MGNRAAPVFLGIDTASSYLALALWSPCEGPLAVYCEQVGRDHAKRIIAELDALTRRADVERAAIEAVAVGVGPGAYTGLRVGIAAAKGLARGLGARLAGADSLAAIASAGLEPGGRAIAAVDARRGSVYAAVYERRAERLRCIEQPRKLARDELPKRYGALAIYEDTAPDAAYVALQAYLDPGSDPVPLYL